MMLEPTRGREANSNPVSLGMATGLQFGGSSWPLWASGTRMIIWDTTEDGSWIDGGGYTLNLGEGRRGGLP